MECARPTHSCTIPIPPPQLVARRRGLAAVSKTLRMASANLRSAADSTAQFHRDMLALSRAWRLRTVGDVVLCDFGNRAIGGGSAAHCEAEVVGDSTDTPGAPMELRLLVPARFRTELGLRCRVHVAGEAKNAAVAATPMGLVRPPAGSEGWRRVIAVANRAAFATELFGALRREALAWHGGVAAEDAHSFTVSLHEPTAMTLELLSDAEESTSRAVAYERGVELGSVLSLFMSMKLRKLQRARPPSGGHILEESARLATTEETRASIARVLIDVAAQVRSSCALSRLAARWDVCAPSWAPRCEITFSSRDGDGDIAAHRRVVEITVGRGSYTALDRHGASPGVRQFFSYTEDTLRAFLADQWRRQQVDVVRSEAMTAGFVVERRAGRGASTVVPAEHVLCHANRGVSLRLRRDGGEGELMVDVFSTDAPLDRENHPHTCVWAHLPGRSPRQRFHAALQGAVETP